jgi:outer membrane protein insertion porin family
MSFGVPITETDSINLGIRYEHTELSLVAESPPSYILYVAQFGNVTNSYVLSGGWSRDTRDDILYPTRGRLQSLITELALPFGDLEYYKINYLQQNFLPIYGDFVLMLRGDVGYADGYGGLPLPFFKAFYAGGVGSVRGYEQSSLGPQDIFGNATGGKRKIVGNVELFYPILKGDKSVRLSAFADAGQIYVNGRDLPERSQFDLQGFRFSAGVGLAWNSPVGTAQIQLRSAAERQAAGQDPALPVPGGNDILTGQERHLIRRSSHHFRRAHRPRRAALRSARAMRRRPITRSASSTPSGSSAKPRRRSARS